MDKDMEGSVTLVAIEVVLLLFIGAALGYGIRTIDLNSLKQDAVDNGYAEWVADRGEITFRWVNKEGE